MANVKCFNFHYTNAIAHSRSVICIKGECNASSDVISVISVTNSNCLVHKMANFKHFNFHHTKAIAHCQIQCVILNGFTVALKIHFWTKGTCNASNDATSVISVTKSNSLMANVKRFNFNHTKAIAHSRSVICIKGECNASSDVISVISVTNSNCLVHKMANFKHFNFHHTKAIAHCQIQCVILNGFTVALKIHFWTKGTCNASNDATSVISVTKSNSLMANVKRFNFNHTKAIAHSRSVICIKGECNASSDVISVISVTNSNCLVHKMANFKHFNFHHTKAIAHCQIQCVILNGFTVALKIHFWTKGTCNASNDATSVISVTKSNSLMANGKRFNFSPSWSHVHKVSSQKKEKSLSNYAMH